MLTKKLIEMGYFKLFLISTTLLKPNLAQKLIFCCKKA